MEHFRYLVEEALRSFDTADHLAYVTYPVVNDIKLIGLILEQVHKTLWCSIDALLEYDHMYKRIQHIPTDNQGKLQMFKEFTVRKYGLARDCVSVVREVNDLIESRKNSNMEFARKDKFVIATEQFRVRTLTLTQAKELITKTRPFIEKIKEVQRSYDRRFI